MLPMTAEATVMKAIATLASGSVVLGLVLAVSSSAGAGEIADHLACRKLGGGEAAKAEVALDSRVDALGERPCTLKRAVLLCSPTARISTVPTPPLDVIDAAELPGDFLCYRSRCRGAGGEQPVADAFGERTVALQRSSLVCVPALLGDDL